MFFKNKFYGSSQLYWWSQTTAAIRNTFWHPCHSFCFAIVIIFILKDKIFTTIFKIYMVLPGKKRLNKFSFSNISYNYVGLKKKIYIHNVFGIFVSLVFKIWVEFLPLYICYHKIAIMSWSHTTKMCVQIHYFCIDVFEKLYC